MASFRIEKDSLGEMKIPDTADYGIHTARAVYPISGILLNHDPEAFGALAACEQIIAGEGIRARHVAGQSFGRSARRKMI